MNQKQVDSTTNLIQITFFLVKSETSIFNHTYKSDHFLIVQIWNKLMQLQIWVIPNSHFPFYPYTFSHLPAVVKYHFMRLRDFLIIYFHIICKNSHNNEDWGVLGYLFSLQWFPHQWRWGSARVYYSGFTTLDTFEIISNCIFFVNIFPIFPPTLSFKL